MREIIICHLVSTVASQSLYDRLRAQKAIQQLKFSSVSNPGKRVGNTDQIPLFDGSTVKCQSSRKGSCSNIADVEIAALDDQKYDAVMCREKCVSQVGCASFAVVDDIIFAEIMCLPDCKVKHGTCKLFTNKCEAEIHVGMSFYELSDCEVVTADDLRCFGATMYNPKVPNKQLGANGCWTRNLEDESCMIGNSECSKLDCSNTAMVARLRYDMVFQERPGKSLEEDIEYKKRTNDVLARFSRDTTAIGCTEKTTGEYVHAAKQFVFTFPLGDCSMEIERIRSTVDGIWFIRFFQTIFVPLLHKKMVTQENGDGIYFEDQPAVELKYGCYFRDMAKTTTPFEVEMKGNTFRSGTTTETFVEWDSDISLSFFNTSSFTHPIDPVGLTMGTSIYFQLTWADRTSDFPVRFYADKCTVTDVMHGKSFDIIQNGCGTTLTKTKLVSNSYYQPMVLRFSYQSFAFETEPATYQMKISCSLKFCLSKDIEAATCGFDQTACATLE